LKNQHGNVKGENVKSADFILYSVLKENQIAFDLVELSGKVREGVKVLALDYPQRRVIFSDGQTFFWNIGRLNFTGKNAKHLSEKVLPEIPTSSSFFDYIVGKTIYIYPYNSEKEEWKVEGYFKYFLILSREGEYSVVYKLSLSAFAPFLPYPENLIKGGEPIAEHKPKSWKEGAKDVRRLLRREFAKRKAKSLKVTFALADGREVTGSYSKYSLRSVLLFPLFTAGEPKREIMIFGHAVDDFWLEE